MKPALKNDTTRISRLFTPLADQPEDGALRGIFERILMLTATPFELGHSELINVLSRLDTIRPMCPPPVEPLVQRLDRLNDALSLSTCSETLLSRLAGWARLRHGLFPGLSLRPDRCAVGADRAVGAGAQRPRAWHPRWAAAQVPAATGGRR